jgi:hypothetical protein
MTDDQGSSPSGTAGRKRPGPTIDLEATEIPANSGAGAKARAPLAWLPVNLPWRWIGGGAAAAVILLGLYAFGPDFSGRDSSFAALDARLAGLELQVRDLAARPTTPDGDSGALAALAGRVAKLEAALSAPRPPGSDPALANRLSGLEGQLKALDEKIGIAARRSDDATTIAREARSRIDTLAATLDELSQKVAQLSAQPVARGEVEALGNRIAVIERATKSLEAELGKRNAATAGDNSVRASVVAAALAAAVERGDPFATELAALKALGVDAKALAPLEPFATSGVPTAAALSRELMGLVPALTKAAGTGGREGSYLDRLAANAQKLVRVGPAEDAPGDDPAAIVTRIQARATQSDIGGALAELAKLPAEARAPAQAWIEKAQARNAAAVASRKLAADALAALGKS